MSGVKLADFDLPTDSVIYALSSSQLDSADWDGVSEEMRDKLHCENANL